ncbi:hypothetical protein D5S18_25615 [Nocardia panacis]|uniref:Uncharacterized protein n=1 Tax=Nocardia panacis TaxID=2340916 RepID=A0A3A4K2E7_9NOCA|nr:hypothetical protein [Nocardia panacis]RJO70604.1 hypothetical protein D5S18_25615 [Nocardia panacis]
MSSQQLAFRLKELGIPPRIGRNSALMQLAVKLPDAVISDLLGLRIGTATEWATIAGNTHLGYAATLARQKT